MTCQVASWWLACMHQHLNIHSWGYVPQFTDPVKGEFKNNRQNIIVSFLTGSRGRKPHFVRLTVEGGKRCFLLFRKHSASSNLWREDSRKTFQSLRSLSKPLKRGSRVFVAVSLYSWLLVATNPKYPVASSLIFPDPLVMKGSAWCLTRIFGSDDWRREKRCNSVLGKIQQQERQRCCSAAFAYLLHLLHSPSLQLQNSNVVVSLLTVWSSKTCFCWAHIPI